MKTTVITFAATVVGLAAFGVSIAATHAAAEVPDVPTPASTVYAVTMALLATDDATTVNLLSCTGAADTVTLAAYRDNMQRRNVVLVASNPNSGSIGVTAENFTERVTQVGDHATVIADVVVDATTSATGGYVQESFRPWRFELRRTTIPGVDKSGPTWRVCSASPA